MARIFDMSAGSVLPAAASVAETTARNKNIGGAKHPDRRKRRRDIYEHKRPEYFTTERAIGRAPIQSGA